MTKESNPGPTSEKVFRDPQHVLDVGGTAIREGLDENALLSDFGARLGALGEDPFERKLDKPNINETEAFRQMGIDAADRITREEAGLPSRVRDLR